MREHKDEVYAMREALRILNTLILEHEKIEETALKEALEVRQWLDGLGKKALVDYLTQATVDYDLLTKEKV